MGHVPSAGRRFVRHATVLFVTALIGTLLTGTALMGATPATAAGAHAPHPAVRQRPQASARHRPPVDAAIVDRFRPPAQPWLPGNRGLEYDTTPGQTVHASASGVVTFAGQIGSQRYLTIAHSPVLSTTYSYVAAIRVRRGEQVTQGQVMAIAGETFHFGARFHGRYIDPERLIAEIPTRRVRLVA